MNSEAAREVILGHGSGYTDANGEPFCFDDGFLGSLRPYRGLREANFHEVMKAVFVLGAEFHSEPTVDREVVESLWSMCTLARHWGLHPDGMLRRNNLISLEDQNILCEWIDVIEHTCHILLGGHPPEAAIEPYANYITRFGVGGDIQFVVSLLVRSLETSVQTNPDDVAKALGAIGEAAESALPVLRNAAKLDYTWFEPHDRCTAETQELLEEVITSIEREIAENKRR